jgi:exosortase/archaeosortase family protein
METKKLIPNKLAPLLYKNKKGAVSFFLRLLLLFSLWFIIYNIILKPDRIIDRPVTNFITASVVVMINSISSPAEQVTWIEDSNAASRDIIVKNGQKVFGIHDICNGIDLMFIYVGILFLLPYSLKRKLIFSAVGILAIILANILRVFFLYYIYRDYRSMFDVSHHYLFTLLIYALIFFGWLLFIKKGNLNEKSS